MPAIGSVGCSTFGPGYSTKVVPPDARPPAPVRTVLVAMEGSPTKARSLCQAVRIASDAGLELVVVHVDDEGSIPSFSDQVQHETDAYAREFLARNCPGATSARLESRVGVPADEIMATVESLAQHSLPSAGHRATIPHAARSPGRCSTGTGYRCC